jgi:hypothetical protein
VIANVGSAYMENMKLEQDMRLVQSFDTLDRKAFCKRADGFEDWLLICKRSDADSRLIWMRRCKDDKTRSQMIGRCSQRQEVTRKQKKYQTRKRTSYR